MRRWLVALLIGLGVGAAGGLLVGWLQPTQDARAGIADLTPEFRAEYTVMVAAAYSENNDWDLAQARLGLLAEPDPSQYVVQLAEEYIAAGRNPSDIRHLVRVAARYGFTTDAMQPFLPTQDGVSQ